MAANKWSETGDLCFIDTSSGTLKFKCRKTQRTYAASPRDTLVYNRQIISQTADVQINRMMENIARDPTSRYEYHNCVACGADTMAVVMTTDELLIYACDCGYVERPVVE